GNRLFLNLPSGTAQARTVQAVNGNTVTVTTPYSETPEAECNWGVDSDDLFIALFRVTGTRDNNDGTFEVTGTTYNPDIYSAVDTGARLDERPVSVIPPGVQAPPGNIVVDSYSTVNQNIAITTMRVAWDAVQGAVAYEAEWRRDSGNWISVPRTSSLGFEVQGIYSGRYLVRVRAVNASDVSSVWATSPEVNLTGKVGNPPKPVGFIASENVVFGIELNWGFPANTDDTLKTEIQYSLTGSEDDAMLLADVPYPQRKYQQMGLKAGQIFWYRAQLVDRTGNESGYTEWVRGQASIDVSDITDVILEEIKDSDTFKDLIENAVDSNEKIAGMADEIKNHADELEQQAKDIQENADGLAQAEVKIDEISVSMDGMTGGVKNSAIAIIQANLAQVATRKTLSASVAGNSAQLDRIDEVIVTDREATARALLSLQTNVNGNTASINSLSQTVSNYQQTTATQINAITATINGNTAAITTNAQAIANVNGQLSAMYNIKVAVTSNGQYYAAGMGIGVENTPSGMQSQVIFLADRFAVTTAAGNSVALPFVIQNGQTFIRASFIQDGTIENAKIGNYIQSNNYVAGSAGWKLDKGGTWENYGSDGQGARKSTNVTDSIRDSNGVLRVQIGKLTGVF
ncbi:host specificity protein J, partial [Enterobacter hormaechei]